MFISESEIVVLKEVIKSIYFYFDRFKNQHVFALNP